MKQPSELTREELERVVLQVRDILWQDSISGELDPDRSRDTGTMEWVSGVLEDAGLEPDRVVRPRPSAEGPPAPGPDESDDPRVAAMVAALRAFVGTIEATGGCVRTGGKSDDGDEEAPVEFNDTLPVPVADESWPDLADAYLLACRALGREPMVRDADADEAAGDGGET